MHNANSERLSERLSTQSIRVLNRKYLSIYIYIAPRINLCHEYSYRQHFRQVWYISDIPHELVGPNVLHIFNHFLVFIQTKVIVPL